MILVDLEVPALDRLYQFSVNEKCGLETLIMEMAEIICQKERCVLPQDREDFVLCNKTGGYLLDYSKNLEEQGVKNSDTLILL